LASTPPIEERLRHLYGDAVFQANVPLSKDFKESVAARKPIAVFKPRSAAAKATQALADEVLARIAEATAAAEDIDRRVA
jgi:chromosome partitioning protein